MRKIRNSCTGEQTWRNFWSRLFPVLLIWQANCHGNLCIVLCAARVEQRRVYKRASSPLCRTRIFRSGTMLFRWSLQTTCKWKPACRQLRLAAFQMHLAELTKRLTSGAVDRCQTSGGCSWTLPKRWRCLDVQGWLCGGVFCLLR